MQVKRSIRFVLIVFFVDRSSSHSMERKERINEFDQHDCVIDSHAIPLLFPLGAGLQPSFSLPQSFARHLSMQFALQLEASPLMLFHNLIQRQATPVSVARFHARSAAPADTIDSQRGIIN